MPMNPIVSNATLTAGLRADFSNTYAKSASSSEELVSKVMQLRVPGKTRTETFAYYETAPYPQIWPYGESIPTGSFQAVSYSVVARRWARRIGWNEDDRKDDQLNDLKNRVMKLAKNYGTLHERVLFQLLQSSTDASLLPAMPNAPDGAAGFATTAGGVARFGATSGNLLTANGVGSVADLHADFYTGKAQFRLYQDTQGEPLHDASDVDQGFMIIYGTANEEIFEKAFKQRQVQGQNAGISNPVQDGLNKVQLWSTSRITTDDWFMIMLGGDPRPMAQIELEGIDVKEADRSNSDHVRDTGEEYLDVKARYGYTINVPYTMLQQNN